MKEYGKCDLGMEDSYLDTGERFCESPGAVGVDRQTTVVFKETKLGI